MRYLAIDHGQKRTGLALCDAGETVVSPLLVIESGRTLIQKIREVVREYQVDALVVGLPYNMDGTEGPRAAQVRRFTEILTAAVALPLDFFDERLSSFEAKERISGLELTRKEKKKRIDAVAAAAILQGYLDAKKGQTAKAHPFQMICVPDAETLASRALTEFLSCANESINRRGRFCMAISGGRTPKRFYRLLQDSTQVRQLPWEAVHLFWADERAVSSTDAASNYRLAAETFLHAVPIPAGNVHRMCGEAEDLHQAARDYEQTLCDSFHLSAGQMPQFDLILLGMGADGHIASLMPNSDVLFDRDAMVAAVFGEKGTLGRLTLTVPVLRAARKLIVLVSGAEKAPIVHTIFQSEPDELKYPAHALWPVLDRVCWILDAEAAKLLG